MQPNAATAVLLILGCVVLVSGRVPTGEAGSHPYFQDEAFLIIAHRGGRELAPENTLPAFRRALSAGADVLEMDIRRSADGHLVVIHDARIDRTTDGRGRVDSLTLAQLQALDAGFHWRDASGSLPHRGQGIGIPLLEEVFRAFPGQRMLIEIKPDDSSMARDLCATMRAHDMVQRVIVASFHDQVLTAFRTACPEAATSASSREVTVYWILDLIRLAGLYKPEFQVLQVPERSHGMRVVDGRFIRNAHAHGLPVHVWTINEPNEMARLLDLGVDGLITDRPDALRRLLRERAARSHQHE